MMKKYGDYKQDKMLVNLLKIIAVVTVVIIAFGVVIL